MNQIKYEKDNKIEKTQKTANGKQWMLDLEYHSNGFEIVKKQIGKNLRKYQWIWIIIYDYLHAAGDAKKNGRKQERKHNYSIWSIAQWQNM